MGIERRPGPPRWIVLCDCCDSHMGPPGSEAWLGGIVGRLQPPEEFASAEEAVYEARARRWVLAAGGAEVYCPTCAQDWAETPPRAHWRVA